MSHDEESAAALPRLLALAEEQLWTDFERTRVFSHPGVVGSGREGAVARFLRQHLLGRFVVTTGQAIDARHSISTQLDLIIYDSHLSAPLLRAEEGAELVPAEALLAVVEVKTQFTLDEARKCAGAVSSISELEPYGRKFVASRTAGQYASDRAPRCMYSIFAFDSNLSEDQWAAKEWLRLQQAAEESALDVSRIDRLTILTRGLIVPPTCTALPATDGKGILRDWFLHLSDFLVREAARRQPYDWDRYGRRPASGNWEKLSGYAWVNQAKRDRIRSEKRASSAKAPARARPKNRAHRKKP